MKATEGFLVVLKALESHHRLKNKKYQGIDRVPSYRFKNQEPIQEEAETMDRYILGEIRNELGLIESYDTALELHAQFAKSPRKFEIIWCRSVPEGRANETQETISDLLGKFIGFDVAGLDADYWSIVGDFPDDKRVASDFAKLNKSGLFDSANDAVEYLNKYRSFMLPDHDSPFRIVEVHKCKGVGSS